MRLLVCGSRDFGDRERVEAALSQYPIETLIHGECRGPDLWAEEYIRRMRNDCVVISMPADWSLGRGAGPERNRQMLEICKPDRALAFWDGKSRGTLDMIRRAVRNGVRVDIIPPRQSGRG